MLHPGWLAGGAEDWRDLASPGRQTGWIGRALAGLGKYSWTQPGWGKRSNSRGVIGRKHRMGSICDTCTLSVRHGFGISLIGFTSSKGKFTSKSNEYYQDKNVLYYVISCIFVGPFVNMKTVNWHKTIIVFPVLHASKDRTCYVLGISWREKLYGASGREKTTINITCTVILSM